MPIATAKVKSRRPFKIRDGVIIVDPKSLRRKLPPLTEEQKEKWVLTLCERGDEIEIHCLKTETRLVLPKAHVAFLIAGLKALHRR